MKIAKQIKAAIFIWIINAWMAAATNIDFVLETANVRIKEKIIQNARKIQKPPY
ncbi:hypothetical protein D3C87_2170240 [compost metagenome]